MGFVEDPVDLPTKSDLVPLDGGADEDQWWAAQDAQQIYQALIDLREYLLTTVPSLIAAGVAAAIGKPFGGATATPTPNDIDAATHNWNIFSGNGAATVVYARTDGAARDVTGLTGGVEGRVCVLFNDHPTSGNITLKRENAGSTAGNRIVGPAGAGDFNVHVGEGVLLFYHASRWWPCNTT